MTRLNGGVLGAILGFHGFEEQFCNMIRECVSTTSYSILINGFPCGFFPSSCGLRQGDPISPVLFTVLSDLLSRILVQSETDGRLSGVRVARTSPKVTHLMYVGDLVIYCKASEAEATEVFTCLNLYYSWTGQSINWDKSSVHFSTNVQALVRRCLTSILGMKECTHNGTYLGNPFCTFKSKNQAFQTVVDKVVTKELVCVWSNSSHSSSGGSNYLVCYAN